MNSRAFLPVLAVTAAMATSLANAASSSSTETHKPSAAILDAGNPGTTLSTGYTTLDQATVTCSSGSCTLSMQIMSNVSDATCKSEWAIVALVDGNSVDGGPLVEGLPSVGYAQSQLWQGEYPVSQGTHTITFELYVPCPADANQWSARYLVTTP